MIRLIFGLAFVTNFGFGLSEIQCGENEVLIECANGGCDRRNCSQLGRPFVCSDVAEGGCLPGCICKEGYLRTYDQICVPVDQCPKNEVCSRQNEYYDECPASCPARDCRYDDTEPCPPQPTVGDSNCPLPMCRCKDGFFKNDFGDCVTREQCSIQCYYNNNEKYISCANGGCDRRNCNELGRSQVCRDVVEGGCIPGCICADNYLRASNGTCVPINQCPANEICARQNEYYDLCPPSCPSRDCRYLDQDPNPCPPQPQVGDSNCDLASCRCKDGFFKNSYGDCVTAQQCSIDCDYSKDEVYTNCVNGGCGRWNCSQLNQAQVCRDVAKGDCIPGCFCRDGYLRNNDGTCVPIDQCPEYNNDPSPSAPSSSNANPGSSSASSDSFATSSASASGTSASSKSSATSSSTASSYYNNNNNKKGSTCGVQCKKNEEYSECPEKVCRAKRCDELGFPLPCLQQNSTTIECGKPACICVLGYVRNKYGVCVPARDCPSCGGDPNAWSGSGTFCKTCDNYEEKVIACPLIYKLNGCDCKPDFVYDVSKKKCVLPSQCANCGPNEEYSSCVNGGCGKRNCTQVNQPDLCIDLIEGACIEGCVCKSGYLRTAEGVCVPIDQCPSKEVCPKPHEYYDTCPPSCPARQCGTDDRLVLCQEQPEPGDPDCNSPSCRCESGYYRNSYGDCVTFEECSITCGTNEIYYPCPFPSCSNQTCENIDVYYNCPLIPTNYTCKGECRCEPGFFRNKVNRCISEEQCKRCQGPYEYFDCDNACDNECDKLSYQSHANCPIINIQCNEMCYCEEGYARNSNKICIPISKCPKTCGKNEVYDRCPSPFPPRTCETKDRMYKCKAPLKPGDPNCPRPTCRCADNYYRNNKGKCVLKEQCPPVCGLNEVAFDCVNSPCLRNKCSQKKVNAICRHKPKNCKPGCLCADGYLRADNGTCVPKDQCPPTCGPFEVYSNCANGGCDKRNCTQVGRPNVCLDLFEGACKGGCVCKEGYLRTAKGDCVRINQCPRNEVCSKPNEYYDTCPPSCPARKCGIDDSLVRCKAPPKPGDPDCNAPSCRCDEGFYRNSYGDCVTFEECSINCGQNEVYYPCPKPLCAKQTCENIDKINNCPDNTSNYTCKGECRCQPGFYRNKVNRCISAEECKKCQGPYEYFDCDNACDNECDKLSYQSHANCPIINIKCNEMCYCQEGYARNSSKICIPISECPQQCGPNEVISDCANSPCIKNCATKDMNYQCRPYPPGCKSGCVCVDGYLRDDFGSCVPTDQCPPSNSTPSINPEADFNNGNLKFTANFFNNVVKANPGKSVILSPYSCLILIAPLAVYSRGETQKQLLSALNFNDKNEIETAIPAILDSVAEQKNTTYKLAAKNYVNELYPLTDSFLEYTKNIFRAEAENVDFSDAEAAANIINSWVAKNTNNKITNLVNRSLLTPDTVLVLVNAIYFLGEWRNKFNPRNTRPGDFYVSENEIVTVDMMNQVGYFNYAELQNLNARALELSYVNSNFTTIIVLPNDKEGATDLVEKLTDTNAFTSILGSFKSTNVNLSLPKYNSTASIDLKDILQKIGLTRIFDPSLSEITGITVDETIKLFVSAGIQKASIIVNENGSEAAAANAIVVGTTSAAPVASIDFIVDHTFIYYIQFRGTPIFCGLYAGNSNN